MTSRLSEIQIEYIIFERLEEVDRIINNRDDLSGGSLAFNQ